MLSAFLISLSLFLFCLCFGFLFFFAFYLCRCSGLCTFFVISVFFLVFIFAVSFSLFLFVTLLSPQRVNNAYDYDWWQSRGFLVTPHQAGRLETYSRHVTNLRTVRTDSPARKFLDARDLTEVVRIGEMLMC